MAEIVMPRLSDTMEEGTILRWLARDGDHIERGQELVEIETDKATMVYESDLQGMLHTLAREGDTLAVGQPIADVGESGTDGAAAAQPVAHTAGVDGEGPALQGPARSQHAATGEAPGERVRASPLARRMAREQGLDLTALSGSGPGGRIVRADVQRAGRQRPPGPGEQPAPPAGARGQARELELTRTQQTIARRMAESKATIPHFELLLDVDMEQCAELRLQLKRVAGADAAIPTYNDMVVKACALALRAHPRANSSYRDGRLSLHERVNVGVAVASEGDERQGGALIVPTVFDADRKALGEIARETRALAARVRDGAITPPELSGATFTVSNLGMYGVRSFAAIINPPQAAILAVGAVAPRAVVREGGISIRHTATLTLACDHRALYGADAARFLAHIRESLQRPAALSL